MKREVTATHIEIADVKSAQKFPLLEGQQTVFEREVWDGKETLPSTAVDQALAPRDATIFDGGPGDPRQSDDSGDSHLKATWLASDLPHKQVGATYGASQLTGEIDALKIRRTTILPKAVLKGDAAALAPDSRERYEKLKALGEGAVGDVALARDNDINRLVAMKHLKKRHHVPGSVARFVEEIQTIGQLEHPNIVPIHDVGVDENDQFYFVMKYVQGQTMGDIIKKLQAGDPDTHEKYPFEVRNEIFLKILEAIQFAHDRGIVHRDLKPENVMIGPHGEVMVMDWGLAKQLTSAPDHEDDHTLSEGAFRAAEVADTLEARRLFETQIGSLIGTPAYMAPEQALGQNQAIDHRSDMYSLSVMYYEWMGLQHYMSHKTNIKDMLWGIIQEEPRPLYTIRSPHQPNVPAEFHHFALKGLQKDPRERHQSMAAMIAALRMAMAGKFDVKCAVTFVKRGGNDTLRMIDAHPLLSTLGLIALTGLALYGGTMLVTRLVQGLLG